MKKVYIKPDSRTIALGIKKQVLEATSPYLGNYADSRQQRDDRYEDFEDYDNDPNDFDNVAFWDD